MLSSYALIAHHIAWLKSSSPRVCTHFIRACGEGHSSTLSSPFHPTSYSSCSPSISSSSCCPSTSTRISGNTMYSANKEMGSTDESYSLTLQGRLNSCLETGWPKILRASNLCPMKVRSQCFAFWHHLGKGRRFFYNKTKRGRRFWRSPSSMWRKHAFSKELPCQDCCINSKNKNWMSIQVLVVQVMRSHGLEIAIPSRRDHSTTSWVLISRGKDRFVDELHAPNVSRNVPSSESLSEQATSKENEPCVVTEIRSRELEAILLVSGDWPQNQCTSHEGKHSHVGKKVEHHPCLCPTYAAGTLSTAISKMVTKLARHFDHGERQTDATVHWDSTRPVLLRAFADKGAHEFSEDKPSSSHHSTLSGMMMKKWQFMATCQSQEIFIRAAIGNMIKTMFDGQNFPEHKIKDHVLAEFPCGYRTQSCATGLHF